MISKGTRSDARPFFYSNNIFAYMKVFSDFTFLFSSMVIKQGNSFVQESLFSI